MVTSTIEITGAGFLAAIRLADSSFPAGLFTQSHGLEAYVHARRVQSGGDVRRLLEDYLAEQVATADAVAAATAWRSMADKDTSGIVQADQALDALKVCRETRDGSARSGKRLLMLAVDLTKNQLLETLCNHVRDGRSPGHYAPMFGAVGCVLGIPLAAVLYVELYSFAASFLGAAMRLLRYDHTEAQKTLTELEPLFIRLVQDSLYRTLHDMRSFSPLAEIMSMHHERNRVRLFSS